MFLAPRFLERLFAPRIPVDRVVRVLLQVRARLLGETIGYVAGETVGYFAGEPWVRRGAATDSLTLGPIRPVATDGIHRAARKTTDAGAGRKRT